MKVKFICIGKTGKAFLEEGEKEYLSRLKHYIQIDKVEISDIKHAKNLSEYQIKELEGGEILNNISQSDFVFLLDEKGKNYSSMDFAHLLQKKFNTGLKVLVFVVGGPYGFSQKVYDRSNALLSLSNMTFSHQMVRMIFFEQLYRAMTILKNEPYHHQ